MHKSPQQSSTIYYKNKGIAIAEDAIQKAKKIIYEELMTYVAAEGGRPNKEAFVPSVAK